MKNPPARCTTFHNWTDLLKSQVEHHGSDTAFTFLDNEGNEADLLTYRELDQRAQAIAHHLTNMVSKGDRVLLLHPPGLDYVAAFYGCLYAGVIAVPLFPPRRNRLEHIDVVARDCAASMVLSTAHFVSEMEKLDDQWYVKSLPRTASDDIRFTALPIAGIESAESKIAYLQYTSGSTSTPKGVIVEHEMMLRQCDELGYGWGVDTETVLVSWLPHFHDFGQVSGVLMPIYSGTRAVLMAPDTFVKSPIRWLSAVSTYRGTHSGAPNFAFDLCVSKTTPSQRAELDLSSWRLVSNGAEPVRKATLERFQEAFEPHGLPATAVTPGYGLAEATLKVTSGTSDVAFAVASFDESALGRRKVLPAEGEGTIELVGCGHTVMDTEIAIVEPESGRRLGDDEIGEIWVSGQIVAPGYWDRPEDSEKTFHARITGESSDRTHLRTGDLGFRYAGELYICGRVKNLMIVNGVNYYLEDIEATVVSSHESLRAGAVIAFSLERNGQENLVLVAEYQPDLAPAAEDLVTVVHHIVARKHGITPMVVLFIDQGTIPRTTSGKLRRQQCKIDFLAGSLSEVHRWVDSVTSETSIAADGSAFAARRSVRDRLQRVLLVLRDLVPRRHRTAMVPDSAPSSGLDTELAGLRGPERTRLIMSLVKREVAAVLGHGGQSAIDESHNFRELGFDSLSALELRNRLRATTGLDIPATLIFDHPTPHAVAEYIDSGIPVGNYDLSKPEREILDRIRRIGEGRVRWTELMRFLDSMETKASVNYSEDDLAHETRPFEDLDVDSLISIAMEQGR